MSGQDYEVSARIVRPGVSELLAKDATVAFDSSPGLSDELPGPAELLCGAFAACLLKNVEQYGTVYNTLAEVCDVDGELIAVAPERTTA